jgi:hypothetical protein
MLLRKSIIQPPRQQSWSRSVRVDRIIRPPQGASSTPLRIGGEYGLRCPVSQPSFPEDARWNAERQAVEFGVEIGEYQGVVWVPRRVLQRLLSERPTRQY